MGVEDDLVPAQSTPEERLLGVRIANLAQDPSDDARARIMAAVRNAPVTAKGPRRRMAMGNRWRSALVGFGATGLLFSASAGALAASSDALPNSPAYGLRRLGENVRVAVASPHQQPRLRLQFAAERLRQAKAQIRLGDVSNATKLLSDSKHDLQDARAELQDVHDPSEVQALAAEEARLQADTVNGQDQVHAIVNGGVVVSPLSPPSATPTDGSNVTAPGVSSPEGPLPPAAPSDSPDSNPAGAPDSAPTP